MKRDRLTMDLLAWQPPQVAASCPQEITGRGPLENRIARVVGRSLHEARDAGRDRKAIAAEMTRLVGRTVSAQMLDKWSSEASEEHRIPLDAFIALVTATGWTDALGFLAEMFGFVMVPERFAGIIEVHLIEEKEAELAARKSAAMARTRAAR